MDQIELFREICKRATDNEQNNNDDAMTSFTNSETGQVFVVLTQSHF